MKTNPYWNSMWSNRDKEFYWSGVKHGVLFSVIIIPCAYMAIRGLIDEFKRSDK